MTEPTPTAMPVQEEVPHFEGRAATTKLIELFTDVSSTVLTAQNGDGGLRSRPMTLLEIDSDARLWFFVDPGADWVRDLPTAPIVNVTVSDEVEARWISACGIASILHNPERARELWVPSAEAFFAGPDDERLTLLYVTVMDADFWDGPRYAKRDGAPVAGIRATMTLLRKDQAQ
jgi:general stress protein 26